MISDPLTLNIGETNQGAVSLGVEAGGVFGSVYAFNGDVDEAYRTASGDDPLEACGLAAGYRLEGDGIWAEATGDWISNLMDSDGIGDYLNGNGIALQSATAGYALSAAAGWGPPDPYRRICSGVGRPGSRFGVRICGRRGATGMEPGSGGPLQPFC